MKYLYGDATPFPLQENFIDTIWAVTDACVALFQLDEELAKRRRNAAKIQKHADQDLQRLTSLSGAIEAALRPFLEEAGEVPATEAVATKLAEFALSTIKQARSAVLSRRENALRTTLGKGSNSLILQAIERFTLRHELPDTQWQLRWLSGHETGQPELALAAMTPSHLHLGFRASIPDLHRWTGPVRLEDIDPNLRIELQHREDGWLRRQSSSKRSIHRFYITQVEISPEHAWFELKQNPAKHSVGYEVSIRSLDQSEILIYPVDVDGERAEALPLAGEGEVSLLELWEIIEDELADLIGHRNRLVWARLDDTDVEDLDRPSELAENILLVLAPIIREIRVRSRVPGELVLKRDLGDGRREELFIPRRDIEKKYSSLPYEYRSYFSAVGLGSEGTQEFVQRQVPANATSPARPADDDDDEDSEFTSRPTMNAGPLSPNGKNAAA
ncbi:MAG: hypothetical protein MJE77_40930 [Proteobacteria bacterium]|nr:hypothetical protein [Pseudomonadota bacterium]